MTAPVRRATRTSVVGLTALSLAATGALLGAGTAWADPDLDRVRERVEQVSDRVDDLYHEAEIANERLLKAQTEHEAAATKLKASSRAVARQSAKLDEMTAEMGGFAAAAYRRGLVDPTLHMVLSENPADALSESMMLDAYAGQQAAALAVVAEERAALRAKQADVEEQAAALEAIEQQMAAEKDALDRAVNEAEGLLDSLEDREERLLAEMEAERQREAERRAEAAARAARDDERTDPPGAEAVEGETPPAVPASGRGGAAVSFALGQVGDAYAYGGTGPSAWDCSGLTSGAWAAAGVAIPRTSQAQLYGLPRVSTSAVQPGDIIVYYSGASHVGIYIGNGQVVHASRPGVPVSVVPMHSMPVVGAVRPG